MTYHQIFRYGLLNNYEQLSMAEVCSSMYRGWSPCWLYYNTWSRATINHAFFAEYKNVFRLVDVLLAAGVNDVLCGNTAEQILADIIRLKGQSFQWYIIRWDMQLRGNHCTVPSEGSCATYSENMSVQVGRGGCSQGFERIPGLKIRVLSF